jgi:hypothetical protein
MNDKETAEHLRKWCAEPVRHAFSWPTDGCGYEQHMRFVAHRSRHWVGGDFTAFVLAYAESLAD